MKLIDAPIGIFRFDGELVLKTEYCSENKLSGKYIPDCYIVRTGEYFFGGAKTANELNNLDVEPIDFAELLPTVTDMISRQAAIEALKNRQDDGKGDISRFYNTIIQYDIEAIEQLPPAQPASCEDAVSRKAVAGIYTALWETIGAIMDRDEWDDVCKATANELPSAQPEIIRCKDCKYGILDYDFPHERYCDFKGNEWNNDDHFCGHAKRREVTT